MSDVKMRAANDPLIQHEVRSLIARMREPGFLGDLAHELVNLRAENAALRQQLLDIRDEVAPIPFPERAPVARIALLAEASGKSFVEYEEEMRGAYPQGVNPLIFDVNDPKHREQWDRAMQSGSRFGGFDANGSEVPL